MIPQASNRRIIKIITYILSLYFTLTLSAYADSNTNVFDKSKTVSPATLTSENVAITFSTNITTYPNDTLLTPKCPTTTSNSLSVIPSPVSPNTTPSAGGSYNDQNFNSVSVPAVPAYFTCYYSVSYVQDSTVTSAQAAVSQILFNTTSVPTSAQGCNSINSNFNSPVDDQGQQLNCQIGLDTAIYQYNGQTIPTNNTSICYDDSAVQTALAPATGQCSVSNGQHIVVAADGASYAYISANSGYNSIYLPQCSSGVYRFYVPPTQTTVTYSTENIYFQSLDGQLASSCTPGSGYPEAVEQDVYDVPSSITVTQGMENKWTIGAPNSTLTSLCYGSCTWRPNDVICAPSDCSPSYENPPLNIAPQSMVTVPYS